MQIPFLQHKHWVQLTMSKQMQRKAAHGDRFNRTRYKPDSSLQGYRNETIVIVNETQIKHLKLKIVKSPVSDYR